MNEDTIVRRILLLLCTYNLTNQNFHYMQICFVHHKNTSPSMYTFEKEYYNLKASTKDILSASSYCLYRLAN